MPIATKTYPITPFDRPAPTTEDLHWADLTELPLDLFYHAKGRSRLVEGVKHALKVDDLGFWSPYERTIADTDVLDNMELVNIPKYTDDYKVYPRHDIFKAHEAVIAEFHRKCWHQIAKPLFVLFALAMELPENYSVERHEYGKPSQDHLRYVKFSDGSYRDIKYKKGSVVVNIADTLSFMTKATLSRIGVLYGCRPNDNVPVITAPSPLLEHLGLISDADRNAKEEDAVTAGG
nr:hypothetical protein I308_06046 [Cryptococcus tetragattii IND107]